jgi:hypothetical protein
VADDVVANDADSLEVGADRSFERGWHRLQKLIWTVLVLFVLAGAAGVFGRGPLSKGNAGSDTGASQLEYERFARYKTPAMLTLTVNKTANPHGQIMVSVSRSLADTLHFEQTTPRPIAMQSVDQGVALFFAGPAVPGKLHIRFAQEPQKPGPVAGFLSIADGGGNIAIRQIVYP